MLSEKRTAFDIAVICTVVLLAILLFAFKLVPKSEEKILMVISEGNTEELSLDSDRELEYFSNGIALTVRIEKGTAVIKSSECTNGICMRSGKVKNNGDAVVCAPASFALVVKSRGGVEDADVFAG